MIAGGCCLVLLTACGGSSASTTSTSAPVPAASSSGSVGTSATNAPNPNAPERVAAGDIPDNQVYLRFTPPGGTFTVSVPQGWARLTEAGATVFSDKYNSVRIESKPAPTSLDVAHVKAQEIPALKRSVPAFVLSGVTTVQRSAGTAVLLTYAASSAPNPVTGRSALLAVQRYEFVRHGLEVTLTLAGAQGADNVDPWKRISDSFRWGQ
jgi:hypothetical protein